tara:strand:+ start:3082 stop:3753 length:672 start_codon:yes stop_codon:yes gene_type:complete
MKFLTFLNSGCLDICLNMLKSAENVGINMDDFIIACMDEDAYKSLSQSGYKNSFLYMDNELKEYQNWTLNEDSGFRNIVKYKWKVIESTHKKYSNLIWVDTDIVFVENPVEILSNHEEVLFQTDNPGYTICTGFMVFNHTKKCRELIEECASHDSADDQIIMNQIALSKYNDYIALLSEDLFPNGNVYYKQGRKENAMIIHNNWMVGIETKMNKFKEEGYWYV